MAGSEFQAATTAVEQVVDHCTTLRYLGVPLGVVNGSDCSDASWSFGDSLSVNSTVMPSGKLQKRSHLLNCVVCHEAQAIINFAHDGVHIQGMVHSSLKAFDFLALGL